MTAVAVVGLGAMGSRVARRLVDAGHDVTVWNRTAAKVDALVSAGAAAASTPAAAAHGVEVVVTMVADPPALRAVTEGPDGVAAGAAASTTVIEMSTVGPAAVARLSSVLSDGSLLEAPVLGSLPEAESGTLRIFVGGSPALLDRWRPLLSDLGEPLHVGQLGAGSAAKLVANSTLFGVLAVLGEAIALGEGLGLEQAAILDVLAATPLAEQANRRRDAFESGRYPPRFRLTLAHKDARLILDALDEVGVDARVTVAAASWFAEAEAAGLGEEDYSAVLARIAGSR